MKQAQKTPPRILPLFQASRHPLNLCTSFILLWVALCDGEINYAERKFFFSHMVSANKSVFDELVNIIQLEDFDSSLLVCNFLSTNLSATMRESLLRLSISIAVLDRRLSISENHLLRLLADILGYSSQQFKVLYKSITNSEFPEPGNPSSIKWWKSKRFRKARNHKNPPKPKINNAKEGAYLILGLPIGADANEVRRAYKRLVQVNHPDRFNSLGIEATEAAHAMFVRIQKAYKTLSK